MTEQWLRNRLKEVFIKWVDGEDDKDDLMIIHDWLEEKLDELGSEDYFGTESQNDPRGDGREDIPHILPRAEVED